jgi:iron complex outermembrane recepter protein
MKNLKAPFVALGLALAASTAVHAGDAPAVRVALKIEPQPVRAALKEFSQQSGVQVLLRVDNISVEGVLAPQVNGELTVQAALDRLLSNTGLKYEFVNERTVRVAKEEEGRKSSTPMKQVTEGGSSRSPEAPPPGTGRDAPTESSKQNKNHNTSGNVRDENTLAEIVVTAQKRLERLIDTPQSVTVMSGDDLAKSGATQFRDFADSVPGLSVQTAGSGLTGIAIRGVTTGVDTLSTVAIYVDEVPYGSSSSFARGGQLRLDVGLFDLNRIEVLRGPQGTLYGASAAGGLIKYVTKEPQLNGFSTDVQVGLSNAEHGGERYNVAAAVNLPISEDKVGFRAIGFKSHEEGYIDNVFLNRKDVNDGDIHGGRLELLLRPTESLGIRLDGFAQNSSSGGFPLADFRLDGTPVSTGLEQRRRVEESIDQRFRLASATVTFGFGPAALTSVSSYQTIDTELMEDYSPAFLGLLNGPPFNRAYTALGLPIRTETNKFTQEIRVASEGNRTVEWLIGGFYTKEDSEDLSTLDPRNAAGQSAPNDLLSLYLDSTYEELAAFGDATWHVSEKFDVTGGVRYARNDQELRQVSSGLFSPSSPPPGKSDEGVFTYLANARYRFQENVVGYVRYATGYRPGGPNYQLLDPATGQPLGGQTFESDELKSYEIGIKADTSDRRFGGELAVYRIDWENIIVSVTRNGFSARANAPDGATINGMELSLSARPLDDFAVVGTFAYQDATLNEATAALGAVKGERLPDVPRATAALTADYELPVGSFAPTLGATVRYVGDRTTAYSGGSRAQYHLPEYTTVDLRAGCTFDRFTLQLNVHNVFDERTQYATPISGLYPRLGPLGIAIGQPRTYGITAFLRF